MPKIKHGVRTAAAVGYQRKWEDHNFGPDIRVVELVDYVGDCQGSFEDCGPNAFGVYYCAAESFYRAFANATFESPCIVDIGEYPAEEYDENGEAITDKRISMAAAFRGSNIQILPHGCSRYMIDNLNDCFSGCTELRHWTPSEMVEAGLAMVRDPDAPRIIRSNGVAESAFLFNLAPKTMARMFAGCVKYDGHAINAISWRNLKDEWSAEDFAKGCRFAPTYLHGIIGSLHWEAIRKKRVRPLRNVHLGHGHLVGEAAVQVRQLADVGIHVVLEP